MKLPRHEPEDVLTKENLRPQVEAVVRKTPVTDIHTHLFAPGFGALALSGLDELLTYHYLVAETLRWTPMSTRDFWALPLAARADLVWQTLFLERSPISEAVRGVLTVLDRLGLDTAERDLAAHRAGLREMTAAGDYLDRVFALAGVEQVVMTNDPFHDDERAVWEAGVPRDPRFLASLRLDALLLGWGEQWRRLRDWGYAVTGELTEETAREVRRFLRAWAERTRAVYFAVSLPADFRFPDDGMTTALLTECVLPVAAELNLPLALMIGVRRGVNPALRLAGDAGGRADVTAVEHLCARYPHNKFLVTMLSRENQHDLCVAARKFRNLLIFGCWWFLNTPGAIEEITRMRFELLGLSFVPQHSDARVLEQLIYKWEHARAVLIDVLCEQYARLATTRWPVTTTQIERDVRALFSAW